jgi:hypothetical protein
VCLAQRQDVAPGDALHLVPPSWGPHLTLLCM